MNLDMKLSESQRVGRTVLVSESEAIRAMVSKMGSSFDRAVEVMAQCKGKVIVSGMGKPGFIARKISATLNSTGTPSQFIHPAEAIHGDLGIILEHDVLILISNSGETQEIRTLIPYIRRPGVKIIAMTSNLASTLAKNADVVLDIGVTKEACPLDLAPTASTTASLAMGDALAMAVLVRKGFKTEDFAKIHPGGSLGQRLRLRVEDIMRTGESNPIVSQDECLKDVLVKITAAHAGAATIVDKEGRLTGIFTDGDLRRHLDSGELILNNAIGELMTKNPKTLNAGHNAVEALDLMKELQIDELPIIDDNGCPIGLVDVQDILNKGIF
ncbi:MAG: KpsF/GutQ family sugar-phosphate isomerase [Chlamydiota bacterium]|nr:KpsF/GutQ family sugar-phosphate isomerase [Chlamydiota bacterium]